MDPVLLWGAFFVLVALFLLVVIVKVLVRMFRREPAAGADAYRQARNASPRERP